tara:strand:- start:191 stop:457 length:267 start_codon:yes stop_codon:yes gene_type:complete
MVDLIMGLGLLAMMIPTNSVILNIARFKSEWGLAIPYISFFANMILAVGYGLIGKQYVNDDKLFIAGILASIFMSMIWKLNQLIKGQK